MDEINTKRISIDLPIHLVEGVDELKKEWGLRARGSVFERLLEEILSKDSLEDNECKSNINNESLDIINSNIKQSSYIVQYDESEYLENKAIILTNNSNIEIKSIENNNNENNVSNKIDSKSKVIDLPGFVSKKTNSLRQSLGKTKKKIYNDNILYTVKEDHIEESLSFAKSHWLSLYGSKPAENVIEASMIWLARDIWPHIEGSENIPFTWTAASRLMKNLCPSWSQDNPSYECVIVMAGILEDPFSSKTLKDRIPTLTRRFVNRFKRTNKSTSFQTLESTMTVYGALKLLELPTKAGSSLTLSNIRDAYREKALRNHPDAGGSTELMRKLNEGYQLLKELYKK